MANLRANFLFALRSKHGQIVEKEKIFKFFERNDDFISVLVAQNKNETLQTEITVFIVTQKDKKKRFQDIVESLEENSQG